MNPLSTSSSRCFVTLGDCDLSTIGHVPLRVVDLESVRVLPLDGLMSMYYRQQYEKRRTNSLNGNCEIYERSFLDWVVACSARWKGKVFERRYLLPIETIFVAYRDDICCQ